MDRHDGHPTVQGMEVARVHLLHPNSAIRVMVNKDNPWYGPLLARGFQPVTPEAYDAADPLKEEREYYDW